MPTVSSSDSNVQVDVHAAWSSALIYSPLSGVVTIYRDGVAIAMLAPNEAVYYDHYPPIGTVSYTASNGATTSTAATVTIPAAPGDQMTWLKSGTDPNLSLAVLEAPFATVGRADRSGRFSRPGVSTRYVIHDVRAARTKTITVYTWSPAEIAALRALIDSGALYYQAHPYAGEEPMWVSVGDEQVQQYGDAADGVWEVTLPLEEVDGPSVQRQLVIPGWSWADVQTMYGSWSALQAANASWLALLRRGVA